MPSFFPDGTYPGMITRTSGLSHYMRLGETTGTLTGDDGDSLSGTMVNVSGNHAGAVVGDSNSSKNFNGTSGYITFGNNVQLVGAFSMEVWIYPTVARAATFLSKENYTSPASGWSWWLNASMVPIFTRLHSSRSDTKGVAVAINTWTHLVVTYDGTTVRQYQNGTLRWEQADSVGMYTSSYPTVMGCMSDYNPVAYADWFPGYIDEWSTYTRALTATEVVNHYNRAKTEPVYLLSVSDSRKVSSTEVRNTIAAIVSTRTDSGIVRSTEEQAIDIMFSRTDAGLVGSTEALTAVTEFAGIVVTLSDTRVVTSTEARTVAASTPLADGGAIAFGADLTLFATRSSTDSHTVFSTESATIQPMHNVAQSYPAVVLRQRGFMHIAAQRLFNEDISVEYKHRDLVNKGAPTVSYFLVKNTGGLPIALGEITTTWENGLIVIKMFNNMEDHLDIMKQFGYFSTTQG